MLHFYRARSFTPEKEGMPRGRRLQLQLEQHLLLPVLVHPHGLGRRPRLRTKQHSIALGRGFSHLTHDPWDDDSFYYGLTMGRGITQFDFVLFFQRPWFHMVLLNIKGP